MVDGPNITIRDNGPGVKDSIEETLFEPFVTDKPRGYGKRARAVYRVAVSQARELQYQTIVCPQ